VLYTGWSCLWHGASRIGKGRDPFEEMSDLELREPVGLADPPPTVSPRNDRVSSEVSDKWD
jgi:hypothetical protein